MNVILPPEDHKMLKLEAIESGRTLASLVSEIVNEGVIKIRVERQAKQRTMNQTTKFEFDATQNQIGGKE